MPKTTKTIKGKQYVYYSYYDADEQKKKEIYCGRIDTREAKKKVLESELEYLEKQKLELIQKIKNVESQLKKF